MYIGTPITSNVVAVTASYQVASAIFNKRIESASDMENILPGTYPAGIQFQVFKLRMAFESSNVIGVLPGTDKKDEYVFLTAHYDHLGVKNGDIYYGADDDGSGTTAVLQMAQAFSQAKAEGNGPRRTMVFMFFSGEEQGLLGSKFYVEHPLYPLRKTSISLNTDMVGRIHSARTSTDPINYMYTIGENRLSSDLLNITDSISKKYDLVSIDRRYIHNDPEKYYQRSDHFNFAKNGVPVIFFYSGTHADYHRTTDTVDKINLDLMSKRVKHIFYTAWVMANRNQMIVRDLPLQPKQ
jgi:Zn-dependent M28 family amino/carboxypeptidase